MPGEIDTLFSRKPEREIQIRIQISGVQLDDANVFETSGVNQNCVNNRPFISLSEKYLDHLHSPAKEIVLPSLLPYQSLHSLKRNFFFDSDSNKASNTSSRDSETSSRKGEPCISPSLSSYSSRQTQTIGYVANHASSSFKNLGPGPQNPISKSCISKTPSGSLTCSRGTETFSRSTKSSVESKNQNSSIGASSILLSSTLQKSKCSIIASNSKSFATVKERTSMAVPQIDKDSFSILGSFVRVESEEEKIEVKKPVEATIDQPVLIESSTSKQRSKSEGRKSLEKDDEIFKSSKSLSKRSSKHSSKHSSKRHSKHRKESKFSLTIERISREKIDVALAMPLEATCVEENMIQCEKVKTEINDDDPNQNQDIGMFDEQKQDLSVYAAQVKNKSKTSTYNRKSSLSEKQSGNVVSRISSKDINIRTPTYSYEKKCNTKEEYEKKPIITFCCFNRKPAPKNKSAAKGNAKSSNQNDKGGCCSKKAPPKKRVWFRVCCCC